MTDLHVSQTRLQRHRQRRRAGKAVFAIEADLIAVSEMLIEAGLLDATRCDDRAAIEAALTEFVKFSYEERP